MRTALRRAAAIATAAAFTAAPLAFTPTALAAEEPLVLTAEDAVAAPDSSWLAEPEQVSGLNRSGHMVFALSTTALNGTVAEADADLPDAFDLHYNDCTTPAGTHGVYVCERGPLHQGYGKLSFWITKAAPDTTVHWAYAWVPAGGDIAEAVRHVQKSETVPEDTTRGHALLTVVTKATAAARNTVAFDTPAVPAGRSARHRIRIHATDPGKVYTYFLPAPGQPAWRGDQVLITNMSTSPGISCTVASRTVMRGGNNSSARQPQATTPSSTR